MTQIAALAFAKNRAEELGFDLWDEFVIPLFFDKLALDDVRKPLHIEGGRGCGKTTLLRYLSHKSQLSPKRHLTRANFPSQIGLYLRADTQYLRAFEGDWLTDRQWQSAFEHALCLMILDELLDAIRLLASVPGRIEEFTGIDQVDFSCLSNFDSGFGSSLNDLRTFIRRRKNELAGWLNNMDPENRPRFMPLKPVLLALINALREQLEFLELVAFFVFIDEYENLLEYQMRVINTLLKHSEPPLIFHIATKRNGMATRKTLGTEQLQQPADYRVFDVEEHLTKDFDLFAAELFCFRLLNKGLKLQGALVSSQLLRDSTRLEFRRSDSEYRKATKDVADRILPTMSNEEIAHETLKDSSLSARLKKSIQLFLDHAAPTLKAEQFIRPEKPMASICCAALLHQGKRPADVLNELELLIKGEPSKFTQNEWIHHYFLGSVLHLYLPLPRPCPIYAGFNAFIKLSRGNIRHFLELCHLSMVELDHDLGVDEHIPSHLQANAARRASALFVKETQGSGDYGNRLFLVVNTLGQIFRLSQQRPSQSEPERTHFSIAHGSPSGEAETILKECIKWSVLFASKETKVKGEKFEAEEYVLNPIYAPYFGISYNKGRKLEMAQMQATQLLVGTRDELDALIKWYKRTWGDENPDQFPLI